MVDAAARAQVLSSMRRRVEWWRTSSCGDAAPPRHPDLDATLCALGGRSTRTLTNVLLLRSERGRLGAAILVDQRDKHINDAKPPGWPARSLALLQQLASLQERVDAGQLPPLPPFTALLSSDDFPHQHANVSSWCGLVPLLSNSAVAGTHRDLLMPDYSFGPSAYLANDLKAPNASSTMLPRGWPAERAGLYRHGAATAWQAKQPSAFWRGAGDSSAARRTFVEAISAAGVLPRGMRADVHLCASHCSAAEGAALAEWCDHQLLLVLPGTSFKVGLKYALLCSSLVLVAGEAASGGGSGGGGSGGGGGGASGVRIHANHEQWWEAGLADGAHYLRAEQTSDVAAVLAEATATQERAAAIGARGAAYAWGVLDPVFVLEYWHALLSEYAALYDWHSVDACGRGGARSGSGDGSTSSRHEETCLRGGISVDAHERCGHTQWALASAEVQPIPPPAKLAEAVRTSEGLERLHRHFATVIPLRFAGVREARSAEHGIAAVATWLRKAPAGINMSAQLERLGQ